MRVQSLQSTFISISLVWIGLFTTPITCESIKNQNDVSYEDVQEALQTMQKAGLDVSTLCHPTSDAFYPILPSCNIRHIEEVRSLKEIDPLYAAISHETDDMDEKPAPTNCESEEINLSPYTITVNLVMTLVCVTMAAIAAGLTMGLLSLDPLDLHIKTRASSSQEERKQAKSILPILQDHHRLLVTLLLLNSIANEALPLFLDNLVPGYAAVIISVTLVLIVGEIIPSAVFTGPNQLSMAAAMVPLVQFFYVALTPLAYPIAKMLDLILGHSNHEGGKYDRNELSVLVRIMYEERLAEKRRRKLQRGTPFESVRNESIKGERRQLLRSESSRRFKSPKANLTLDEVTIVEGALQMRLRTVKDVYKAWENVKWEEKNTTLDEEVITNMFSHGHSRIPVIDKDVGDKAVCGVFLIRDLALVNPYDENAKAISEMPTYQPDCISLDMNLVDLLNRLQTGGNNEKGGHLAIVCRKPDIANEALNNNKPIPEEAMVVGIVTLEDVIEELIQEEIYDETDVMSSTRASALSTLDELRESYRSFSESNSSLV